MKLIAPMFGVMDWLKQLQAEGSPLVVERLKKKGHIDPAQPCLLDPEEGQCVYRSQGERGRRDQLLWLSAKQRGLLSPRFYRHARRMR